MDVKNPGFANVLAFLVLVVAVVALILPTAIAAHIVLIGLAVLALAVLLK